METDAETELVSAADAALELGLNREQVVRRVQAGQLAGGKYFGRWYVDRVALKRALAGQTRSI